MPDLFKEQEGSHRGWSGVFEGVRGDEVGEVTEARLVGPQ